MLSLLVNVCAYVYAPLCLCVCVCVCVCVCTCACNLNYISGSDKKIIYQDGTGNN